MNRLRQPGRQGFSLLEMVVALFIVSILFGMAVMATRSLLEDEQLRSCYRKLALTAKTARQQALLENRPYEIVLVPGGWTLKPAEKEESESGAKASTEEESEPEEYFLPETIKMKIRLWGSSDWEKSREVLWYFSPTGLCAPNTFRFEKGDSWMQATFNPLTANLQEEEWYLP